MKLLPHLLIALMASALLGGASFHVRQQRAADEAVRATHLDLMRFQQQLNLQRALNDRDHGTLGYPRDIDPAWFGEDRPINALSELDRPWVEIASSRDHERLHPRSLVMLDRNEAAFWYNPFRGVVRARVPAGISDQHALDLYNEVNECALESLFQRP